VEDRNAEEALKLINLLDRCKCDKCQSEIVRLKKKYGWIKKD
jgi:hypothetical protein